MNRVLFFLFAVCISCQAFGQVDVRSYQIGNSLTNQSSATSAFRKWHKSWTGFDGWRMGRHIRCGSALIQTYTDPFTTCASFTSRGNWLQAWNFSDYDHVVFQPHFNDKGISTLGSDYSVISKWIGEMIEVAEKTGDSINDVNFYIMQGWPEFSKAGFSADWNAVVPDQGDTPTTNCRVYYRFLFDRLKSLYPDINLYLIPTGETFYQLDQHLSSNPITVNGSTLNGIYDLYSDEIHPDARGRLLAGSCIYSQFTGFLPRDGKGMPWLTNTNCEFSYASSETPFSNELYQAFYDSIEQSVASEPRAKDLGQ